MASFTLLLFFALMTSSVFSQAQVSVSSANEAANSRVGKLKRSGSHIVYRDIATSLSRNAAPCTATGCKWPKKRSGYVDVPVKISPKYTKAEREVIIKSLASFHSVSCIRFIWKTSERDYLSFYPSTGCWSYVGRQKGRQAISLQQGGCVDKGIIQHEILHALGFHHEQARSDRDDFVDIIRDNIRPGKEGNFAKVNTNNLATPYDYNSIMHYGRFAFSKKNGILPTLVPKPDPTAIVGQAREMSGRDIQRVNALYKCCKWLKS